MFPLVCQVNLCSTILNSQEARLEHAKTIHGYPVCFKCNSSYKNVNLFENHLNVPHELNCGFPICRRHLRVDMPVQPK